MQYRIDLIRWSVDDLASVAATLNARPRNTLGWRAPAEALSEHLFHRPVLHRVLAPKQYQSICYSERIAVAGITPSVGAVGSSYDALAETINGLYKTEVIRRLDPWHGVDQVEHATAEWVHWFNTSRLFEYCGDVPPVELENAHYHQNQPPTEAA